MSKKKHLLCGSNFYSQSLTLRLQISNVILCRTFRLLEGGITETYHTLNTPYIHPSRILTVSCPDRALYFRSGTTLLTPRICPVSPWETLWITTWLLSVSKAEFRAFPEGISSVSWPLKNTLCCHSMSSATWFWKLYWAYLHTATYYISEAFVTKSKIVLYI